MGSVIVKSLQGSNGTRVFLDNSRRDSVTLGTVRIGRGMYRPGWRWSVHAGPLVGKSSAVHVGYIVSGQMTVRGPDGAEVMLGPGDAFEAPPGHDAWVVGDEPCVALDFASNTYDSSNGEGRCT